MLEEMQRELFAIGARLADPSHRIAARVTKADLARRRGGASRGEIDRLEAELPPLRRFILPGGVSGRRARCTWRGPSAVAPNAASSRSPSSVDPIVVVYLNRLSDLLFVMARAANHRSGVPETEW